MPNQARVAKVLAILLASMTVGAIILMALGHNPPSAGPFSLWTYYSLDPVNKAISSRPFKSGDDWNSIEIYYSGTQTGNIDQLTSLNGLSNPDDIKCHFCVYNGFGGSDGQIQTTNKWKQQSPATSIESDKTIRICLIADGKTKYPTDCQLKRIQVLVDALCKKFRIQPRSIDYPSEWR